MSPVFVIAVWLAIFGLALWLWSISVTNKARDGWYADLRQRIKMLEKRVNDELEKRHGGR